MRARFLGASVRPGHQLIGVALALVVLAMGTTGILALGPSAAQRPSLAGAPVLPAVGLVNCSSLLAPGEIAAEVGPGYVGEVGSMFDSVCGEAVFDALVSTWGAMNLSLGAYSDAQGLRFVYFTESWANWSEGVYYGDQAYWTGNVTSDRVTGPVYLSGPASCAEPAGCGRAVSPDTTAPATAQPPWAETVAGLVAGAAGLGAYLAWRRGRRESHPTPPTNGPPAP